ncbi:hypothetical protein [Amycolatopsis plumensis]|uniref:hypothetical protein n=1 Tax=Amycolatopsis plumensis TaxID=236508 RepID=UPI003616946E
MSTKIPNGFRLAEGTDLAAFTDRVRSVIDPLRDQEDVKLLAIETAKFVTPPGWPETRSCPAPPTPSTPNGLTRSPR